MAETLGGIEYYVEADTGNLVVAEKDVKRATEAMEADFKKVDTQVKKTSKDVKANMAAMGRSSGQAAIQFQQLIGQVQGGQSVMLALSQQSADLGFVLGAPLLGSIIGISASIASFMVPSLIDGENAMDSLAVATEKVETVMKLASNGTLEFSQLIAETAQRSEDAARALVSIAIGDQLRAQQEAVKSLGQAYDDLGGWLGKTFGQLADHLAVSREQLGAYEGALQGLQKNVNEDSINRFERAVIGLGSAGVFGTKTTAEFAKQSLELVNQLRSGQATIEQARVLIDNLAGSTGDAAKESELAAKRLEAFELAISKQKDALGLSKEELALWKAEQLGASEATKQAIQEIYAYEAAQKAAKKADTDSAAAKKQLQSATASAASGLLNPTEKLRAQLAEQQEIFRAAKEQELITEQQYLALRQRANESYVENLKALDQGAFEQLKSSLEGLQQQAVGAFAMVATGAMDGTDAVRALATSILQQAIGAIVQMGIEYVKTSLIKKSADQAVAVNDQVLAAAAATKHTAAVAATVAELTSIGSAAAYASTAAIPIIGPAAAPAAAAAAGTAISGIGAAAISAAPIAGQRQFGGDVSAGMRYQVGEANKPELLMIPGQSGRVYSNNEMKAMMGGGSGGSTSVVNQINVPPGYTATESQRTSADGLTTENVINIVEAQANNPASRMNQGVRKSNSTSPRLGGNPRPRSNA